MKQVAMKMVDKMKSYSWKRRRWYQEVFGGEFGDLVLADLFHVCGQGKSSHVPGDPYTTGFNEGKRSVFNHIMAVRRLKDADLETVLDRHREIRSGNVNDQPEVSH